MPNSILKTSKITAIAALALLMLFISSCSSGDNNNSKTPPIVTSGGKITRDTLVSFIRHFGKLKVFEKTLRQEIIINDTSKIKKLLGTFYPLWLDKHTNRILKVPFDVYVSISFDIGEIALSVKETGDGKFSVPKPTPIVDITGIIVRFDQEYRDIGTIRFDIDDEEFDAAWQAANVPDMITTQIAKEQKDEFVDVALNEAVSDIINRIKKRYQSIDFKFEQEEQVPVFSEVPTPKIEAK